MGFTGGCILEPATGIGHFFGLMPEELNARSTLTGIGVDPLTAAIAQQLYPDTDVRATKANRRAFRGDPDAPLLCSLEDCNDDTKLATKAAIFHERTIQQTQPPSAAASPHDALIFSLNETGGVDLARMDALLGRSPNEFLPELKGLVYSNPATEQWETDDQYLSGDVREKLIEARAAAATDSGYLENVTALETVQPDDLTASEIDARLGAVWIPAADVEEFAASVLGVQGITVSHAAALGTWFVRGDFNARGTVANTAEWGTMRYSALELIQDALNLKTPTVHDRTKDTVVINVQETETAKRWPAARASATPVSIKSGSAQPLKRDSSFHSDWP